MKKHIIIAMAFLFIWVGPVLAADEVILAKIGDRKISMTDFNRMLGYYDAAKQKALTENPKLRVPLLNRYVKAIVLAELARKEGFDKQPDIKEQSEMLTNDFVATEFLKKKAADAINISADAVRQYYELHKDEFKSPEMVRARHILIRAERSAIEEEKKKARLRAEDVLKRVKAGEDFSKLAAELSEDPGAKIKGGDLGFFPKGRMVPEFEKVVFEMKPGEVSGIVETPYGYHIIKVEEIKAESLEPLDKVSNKVKDIIFAERRKFFVEDFIEKAMKNAGVELNTEALDQKK